MPYRVFITLAAALFALTGCGDDGPGIPPPPPPPPDRQNVKVERKAADLPPKTLSEPEIAALKSRITELWQAGLERDVTKVMKMSHFRLFEISGGRLAAEEAWKVAMEKFDEIGMVLVSEELGEPSPVYRSDDGYVVFVPSKVIASSDKGRAQVDGFHIAIGDVGTWKFLGSHGISKDKSLIEKLIPGLEAAAIFPTHTAKEIE